MLGEYYYAAGYLRLSREDPMGTFAESNSIGSQRDLVDAFVRQQTDMELYDIYIDSGYSGMDFHRPEFRRMMEDVSLGKVNCIIVKDLSRFGRDYIEVGRWIQKTLPSFGVRFIAITDRYDSKTATGSETSLILPVKNFINDSYCRDISQKVRSHQQIKREKGEFIGAFAVYGYCKSQKNRHRLVKDPYAAEIVRKIYRWKLGGISMLAIAERLNQAGILSPMEYKHLNGEKFYTGFCTEVRAKWSAAAVKRILEDERYTGTLVQGKEERISYKVKKSFPKRKEEWIRVSDCHEAIVTKQEYQMVQRLLHVPVRVLKDTGRAYPYAGLLFCADCKKPLIRRKNRYKGQEKVFYICSTKNKGLGCSRHSIEETVLQRYIDKVRKDSLEEKKWMEADCKMGAGMTEALWKEELEKLKKDKERYQELCSSLEANVAEGILTKEEADSFFQIYIEQENGIEEAITRQRENLALFGYWEDEERERRQERLGMDRIEVEEGGCVRIVLNGGEIYRLSGEDG